MLTHILRKPNIKCLFDGSKNILISTCFPIFLTLLSHCSYGQSSVVLYGIVDDAVIYQNSQTSLGSTANGRSTTKLSSGVWAGDRFGLQGMEALGAGLSAIFTLESGLDINSGAQQYCNAMFGRQAFVGLSSKSLGIVNRRQTIHSLISAINSV
ncbi:porin [Caballeronia novacaledonica]|uniref:porin n=1 Tax=Caballeronia novacaledonica TaxID=1544861 RepID=UPI001EE13483|nr:porin [Caballeronia novacaledonica]